MDELGAAIAGYIAGRVENPDDPMTAGRASVLCGLTFFILYGLYDVVMVVFYKEPYSFYLFQILVLGFLAITFLVYIILTTMLYFRRRKAKKQAQIEKDKESIDQ